MGELDFVEVTGEHASIVAESEMKSSNERAVAWSANAGYDGAWLGGAGSSIWKASLLTLLAVLPQTGVENQSPPKHTSAPAGLPYLLSLTHQNVK